MFDQIMENAMPLWILASAVFPIFFFGMIIKAIIHFNRTRGLSQYFLASKTLTSKRPFPAERSQTVFHHPDWIPSP